MSKCIIIINNLECQQREVDPKECVTKQTQVYFHQGGALQVKTTVLDLILILNSDAPLFKIIKMVAFIRGGVKQSMCHHTTTKTPTSNTIPLF